MKKSSQAVSESAAFTVTIGGVGLCLTQRPGLLIDDNDDASAMFMLLSKFSNSEVLIDLNASSER